MPDAEWKHDDREVFQRIAVFSLDLLCIATLHDTRFRWLSPNWSDVLGWSLDELCERPFVEFIHPDDLEGTKGEVDHQLQGGQTLRFENRYRTKTGGWRWLQWTSQLMDDADTVYAIARDVTEIKEHALEDSERASLLELAAEISQVGFWRLDAQTQELTWSEQTYRIHGLDPQTFEPTLESAIAAYHPDDRERVSTDVGAAIQERRSFEFELRLIRADGATREVEARGRVQTDDAGEPSAVFGTFQDVTEARALQRRLHISERMASLGTLAAGVAHEINNPLTYVLGNLSLLRDALESSRPDLAQLAGEALQGAQHVGRIVEGLRAFSTTGEQPQERVTLSQLIDSALLLSENQVRHRCRLSMELSEPLPQVRCDKTRVVQVLVNLLVNAAQALPEDRESENAIVVRALEANGEAVIEVEDNGPGIPAEVQPRVFDPFFSTRGVGKGMGLGLAISHATALKHGGRLEFESSSLGTVFRLTLPCADDDADAAEAPAEAGGGHEGRLLIIDDEPLVGRLMERFLGEAGFVVEWVETAAAGLERLEGGSFDLVICDLMMPAMNGWDFYALLGERWPQLSERVVFMTGGAFSPAGSEFLDSLPPERVLKKPFMPADLVERVGELLA